MNITIFHYETSTSRDYYDKEVIENVHSAEMDLLTNKSILVYIDSTGKGQTVEYAHPVYIEFTQRT